ncbi:MAG: hypothetical protein KDA83_18690 [Planctomycetales bacterium]|nr:hypothetical protein [Planctomycetales bacterium]
MALDRGMESAMEIAATLVRKLRREHSPDGIACFIIVLAAQSRSVGLGLARATRGIATPRYFPAA